MLLDVAGPNVGDLAPDFTLREAEDTSIHLADYRDQPVVLIFYRGGW